MPILAIRTLPRLLAASRRGALGSRRLKVGRSADRACPCRFDGKPRPKLVLCPERSDIRLPGNALSRRALYGTRDPVTVRVDPEPGCDS